MFNKCSNRIEGKRENQNFQLRKLTESIDAYKRQSLLVSNRQVSNDFIEKRMKNGNSRENSVQSVQNVQNEQTESSEVNDDEDLLFDTVVNDSQPSVEETSIPVTKVHY